MEEYGKKGRVLRCELDAGIKFRLQDRGPVETRTIDISENGLRFYSPVEIPIDTQLDIDMEGSSISSGRKGTIHMTAKVNSLAKTENGYEVGIQFLEISAEDKKAIADYLRG